MINPAHKILSAWFALLNGNLSVPVFRTDAPADYEGNYVIIRIESATDTPNNHVFISNPVLITEVVTSSQIMLDDSVAPMIDEEIGTLLYSSPRQHRLPAQTGIQITSVQRRDATYLPEDDGTKRFLRLITRNIHRVEQLN